MTTSSHRRTLCLVIGMLLTAALLLTSTVGGRTSALQTDQPTAPGLFQCDDSGEGYRVAFAWTRRMPGNGAWLGTVTVSQGTKRILSKPIQVFDATGTNPITRQFQAQDGSFYCRKMVITGDRRSVSWSDCRNWVLADQTCLRQRPGGGGDNQP